MAPTFASAAAGGTNSNSPRPDSSGEWSRRTNGATQTFRRPSATTASSTQREPASQNRNSLESVGPYIPPHVSASRNGASTEHRYSSEQLHSLVKSLQEFGVKEGISDLFVAGWDPYVTNGNVTTSWGRRDEQKDVQSGPEVCWEREADLIPLGLTDMTADEKEIFATSVNSPIKPPTTTGKESTPREGGHRKSSVSQSQNSPGGFGLASPTSRTAPNRRREPSEAYPFPHTQQPGGMGRFSREEAQNTASPPPSLLRRRTDFKDQNPEEERDKEKPAPLDTSNPFGSLKRTTTGGLSGGGSGTWGNAQSSTFSPLGAFGSFALGPPSATANTPTDKRPGFGSLRSESRFKGLMKDATDDNPQIKEKSSVASLGRPSEDSIGAWPEGSNRPASKDIDPFPEEPSGSAALLGADDFSPPRNRTGDFSHQTPSNRGDGRNEPMSPTNTNPYQSPEGENTETTDMIGDTGLRGALPGLGGFGPEPESIAELQGLGRPRGFEAAASDRSQTSSAGPPTARPGVPAGFGAFPGLGGLPGLGTSSAWNGAPPSTSTPVRERAGFGGAFGDGIFSPVGDNPQGLGGLGGNNLFGGPAGAFGSIGRSSKLPSLLQQDQIRSPEHRGEEGFDPFERQQPGFANLGRNAFGPAPPSRDTNSPFRSGRGNFEDMIPPPSGSDEGANQSLPIGPPGAIGPHRSGQPLPQRQSSVALPTGGPPPISQVRQMVMPDRMKWLYKDPQGNPQGPWSGLEMHDWYRAGFFTPELLIKKVEDGEYEPLAQLIRRIGNSREPFLVPQIGVPHDPPASARGWNGNGTQPPFAGSFPSFGTTLTAEQQNALERRKQEEQYLMARQKEHLAQQQLMMKMQQQMQHQMGHPGQLHHHSSTHSLQSQPSFGSINAPGTTFPSSQGQSGPLAGGQAPGLTDPAFRGSASGSVPGAPGLESVGNLREGDVSGLMERLSLARASQPPMSGGAPGPGQSLEHSQQVLAMLEDRARLEQEQAAHNALQHQFSNDPADALTAERLMQFHDLRADEDDESELSSPDQIIQSIEETSVGASKHLELSASAEQSITQQVQAAVSAKASGQHAAWARGDHGLLPPPQSTSPMPAPVAQRKQNVADTLAAGSRSRSQTPSVDTPSASIAPWAKENVEAPKGPSLKEIQEAEAKKAAQQEELAAAARRAAYEKELQAARAVASPQPGLPSSSTWASSSPATATPSSSVWSSKAPAKGTTPSASAKKTLQQIQKEEEARKQRAAAVAAASIPTVAPAPGLSSGKRYADLASKTAQAAIPPTATNSAWTTVGAGGKVKNPVPTGPSVTRSVSGSVATQQTIAKPKAPTRSTTLGGAQLGKLDAVEEFKKWAAKELGAHLKKGIDVDSFVDTLLVIGLEADILTEAVHSSSNTIDSRHFAEEFIRRRKLADKGVADPAPALPTTAGTSASGGWSEVAKKGPQTPAQENPSNFKVVASKKKGGRR